MVEVSVNLSCNEGEHLEIPQNGIFFQRLAWMRRRCARNGDRLWANGRSDSRERPRANFWNRCRRAGQRMDQPVCCNCCSSCAAICTRRTRSAVRAARLVAGEAQAESVLREHSFFAGAGGYRSHWQAALWTRMRAPLAILARQVYWRQSSHRPCQDSLTRGAGGYQPPARGGSPGCW